MIEKTVTVNFVGGFHFRPIARFIHEASKYQCSVVVSYKGKSANGFSSVNMMLLAIPYGAKIKLAVNGEGEEELISVLENFITNPPDTYLHEQTLPG